MRIGSAHSNKTQSKPNITPGNGTDVYGHRRGVLLHGATTGQMTEYLFDIHDIYIYIHLAELVQGILCLTGAVLSKLISVHLGESDVMF